MRILHVITRMIVGGAQENTLFNCQDLQREHGDEVLLVSGPSMGPEGSLLDEVAQSGVRLETISDLIRAVRPLSDLRAYRRLKSVIGAFEPDVVHTHSSKAGILGRAAAHAMKVPAIVHTIHGLPFHPFEVRLKNALYVASERWGARRCHRIISVADAMTRQALAKGVGQPSQFVTIYSGMDVEPFLHPPRSREAVREELGILPSEVVVMKIARLFELKGHDDVISAAREMGASSRPIRFVFVGGGEWKARLEARVHAEGMGDRFLFVGLVRPSRVPELLGASDIVVHASYREGLARVLPQALIAGCPVISYDIDGAREVVVPGETGVLLSPGDIRGMSESISMLSRDSSLRHRFGEEGRRRFTDAFRHQEMTRRIREVYLDVLSTSASP